MRNSAAMRYLPGQSGMPALGVRDVRMPLGIKPDWYCGAKETSGQLGAVFNVVAAITAGGARHVLVFRAIAEASARAARPGATASGGGPG